MRMVLLVGVSGAQLAVVVSAEHVEHSVVCDGAGVVAAAGDVHDLLVVQPLDPRQTVDFGLRVSESQLQHSRT